MKPIAEVAKELGISSGFLRPYGTYKAKIALDASSEKTSKAKLVLVTAMSPTPSGEGKTVTSIGLASALNQLGHKSVVCVRQPSLGPLFGIKGGAAGGGMSTVEPMQEINMRFTGDIDAVAASHNLLSAMLDNHLYHGNELRINPKKITWNRTLDMNDRALRHVIVETKKGVERDESFVITAASEVMAILSLSKDYHDLKDRLGKILVAFNDDNQPVTTTNLSASGAMAAILKDALQPNLAQTSNGTPALIHGGPFGNIATGTSSLVSIRLGISFADYCVVEAGFGSDLGAEKFFDIVARMGGLHIDSVVIVASIKAIKYHGYSLNIKDANQSSPQSSADLISSGFQNLKKHIENVQSFGILPVVALNRFPSDTEDEIRLVRHACEEISVPVAISEVFAKGADGGVELARLIVDASQRPHSNHPAYEPGDRIEDKIEKVVQKIYGGDGAELSPRAIEDIQTIQSLGFERLPICVAKTALSLSEDPEKLGRPKRFTVKVTRIGISAGAGFVIPYMGEIMVMPGLPKHPAAERIDMLDSGEIIGLF